MKKIDFDTLLTPIAKTKVKDVSLVEGYSSISQQIRNVVLLGENEIPFSSVIGSNVINILSSNSAYRVFAVHSINGKIPYAIKNVFKVHASLENNSTFKSNVNIKIKFFYRLNPESPLSPSELSIPVLIP